MSYLEALKKYGRENLLFLAGTLLVLQVTGLFLLENGHLVCHLRINSYHTEFADRFFSYFTHAGGAIPSFFALGLMIFRFRSGLFILFTQGTAALITQPLKYIIGRPRPLSLWTDFDHTTFTGDATVWEHFSNHMAQWADTANAIGYNIPGGYNSFPSGHTSAVFAFMACLAALLPPKYKNWQIAFLLIGVSVAYSRIYLSCHFLEDTMFGAFIGVIATAIVYTFMYRTEWGDKPIYKLTVKK